MDQVQTAKQMGFHLGVSDKALIFVKGHFVKMGWGSSLPENDSNRRAFLTSFFKALTYENRYHPRDLPFAFVLPEFFQAVQDAIIEDVFPSEASHKKAFKNWIGFNRTRLRRAYAQKYGLRYQEDEISQLHAKPVPIQRQLAGIA